MTSSSIFWRCFVSLVKFSYWFMSVSSLVLELWQFPFIRNWPEVRKSEIPTSEFCSISRDWGKLGIPNLAQTSLIKCYWMLQNAWVTALTVSELLQEYQQGGGLPPNPHPTSPDQSQDYLQLLGFWTLYFNFMESK